MYIFMWETLRGERKWEAVQKGQNAGFMERLLKEGVHPATIMIAYNPILWHWVFTEFHKGLSDVYWNNINEDIYGTEPVKTKRAPLDVPVTPPKPMMKYGWLAPDGRFFNCDYGGHSYLADKIVGDIEYVANPERHLEENGWAKILSGSCNGSRYTIAMGIGKKLTDAQLKTLQKMDLDKSYGISDLL